MEIFTIFDVKYKIYVLVKFRKITPIKKVSQANVQESNKNDDLNVTCVTGSSS